MYDSLARLKAEYMNCLYLVWQNLGTGNHVAVPVRTKEYSIHEIFCDVGV